MPHWLELTITAYLFGVLMTFLSAMRRKNRPAFFRNWAWGLFVIVVWFMVIPLHYLEMAWRRASDFIEAEKLR